MLLAATASITVSLTVYLRRENKEGHTDALLLSAGITHTTTRDMGIHVGSIQSCCCLLMYAGHQANGVDVVSRCRH